MAETPTQELARRLRLEAAGIGKGTDPDTWLCHKAVCRLEELEAALMTMLSMSQFEDRSHAWVGQAEEKAQAALLRPLFEDAPRDRDASLAEDAQREAVND